MSDDDLKSELERLCNENAALKKGAATGITLKVSDKGGLFKLRHYLQSLSRDIQNASLRCRANS